MRGQLRRRDLADQPDQLGGVLGGQQAIDRHLGSSSSTTPGTAQSTIVPLWWQLLPEPRLTSRQTDLRDALVEMVLAEGFSRLTIDQVAATLNCSKRTLYALAASKEQLAVLAVRHFFQRATEQVEAAIARDPQPGRAGSTRYLEAVAEALRPAVPGLPRRPGPLRPGRGDLRAEHRRRRAAGSGS